jgi:membrane-bound serine protease (ClpP class)
VGEAKKSGAVLIMAFDTPGGEITRMRQFAGSVDKAIQEGVHVIGWVDDEALSAGTWIYITTSSLYMRERSTIGAAQAVQLSPGGMVPAAEKYASAYRAWVRAWADDHGRSPLLAQAMIDPATEVRRVKIDGVEQLISGVQWNDMVDRGETPELLGTVVREGELWAITGRESIQYGFADALAESVDEVLAKEGLAGTRVVTLEPTRGEDLLASLHGMRILLLFLGLVFGYIELKVPGFGIPGVLSLSAFVVLFAGQYLIGLADVPHMVLAGLGITLVAAELFVLPGMIWPGLVGALCLITGLLMSQVGPGLSLQSAWDREILFDASFQMVLTAALSLAAIWLLSRFLPNTPLLGRIVLAGGAPDAAGGADGVPESRPDSSYASHAHRGVSGRAKTTLRPVGIVQLDGDDPGVEHEARSESGLIEAGSHVTVIDVAAGRLVVRPSAAS